MIKAVVIDDEPACRKTLISLLEEHCPQIQILGEANNALSGRALIEKEKPAVVFLDIEMPDHNGFELLNTFSPIPFQVVFVSAFSHFAIKAIRFAAIDYLVKPVQTDELVAAVSKLEKPEITDISSQYEVFLQHIQPNTLQRKKVVLKTLHGFEVIELRDIIRCEGERNYTTFHFTNRKSLLVSKTLKEFEQMFSSHNFLRVHQSHLINLNEVKRYIKGRGGYVVMSDDSSVDVARDKKDLFLQGLEKLS